MAAHRFGSLFPTMDAGYIACVATLNRRLAAVWFADIVGYTRLSEEDEDQAVRLAHAFQRVARGVVQGFGGRVVKFLGDGALAEFSSTEMAVRSAHALLAAFARAADEGGLRAEGLRVGVHVGDVAATADGDLYGDGVNVASRLQSAAEPGEVWVSEDVRRQLRRRPELRFEPRGEHELKGIGQPMQAHSVAVLDETEWTPPAPGAPPAAIGRPSLWRRPIVIGIAAAVVLLAALAAILTRDRSGLLPSEAVAESAAPGVAVLPFSVNDPELERWREGMVDLLTTNLDGAGGLRAIDSRTVLARWREIVPETGVADLPTALEVARRAGGRYGLVGSAVSSGASMRLSAELYDLENDKELGRPQVEGSPDSIFALVDRLSIQVLALILAQPGAQAPAVDLASVTTSSLPALKDFLEAEGLSRRGDFPRAIPAYEGAIEADSTFALAHYRLGDAYGWSEGINAGEVRREYAAAERFADRLPPRDADLLDVSLAYTNARGDATALARDATRRYPDDPGAWYLLGEVYFHMPYQSLATVEEQREPFARAFRLDPTFLPAEIHLLDLAFAGADQAAADSLIRRFDPATAGSDYGDSYTTAYALAFGDSITRSRALTRLRALPFSSYRRIHRLLGHPRFTSVRSEAFRIARSRPEYNTVAPRVDFLYGEWLLASGRLEELTEAIETQSLSPAATAQTLTIAYFAGLPLPLALYEMDLSPGAGIPFSGPELVAALRALDSGDRARARRAIAEMRATGESLLARGDSTGARQRVGLARVLEARDAMLQSRESEALSELEAIYREAGLPPAAIWAAEILDDEGEIDRAIRYLEQLGASPLIGFELGELYEKAGRREEALEAYGWVLLGWAEADEVLQPRVAQARQAVARLEGLQRG